MPPIREAEEFIEIDVKKGHWPFIRLVRGPYKRILILMEANDAGSIVMGRPENMAAMELSPKKAKAIRKFLERTEL
jgi:hypothetical protein